MFINKEKKIREGKREKDKETKEQNIYGNLYC